MSKDGFILSNRGLSQTERKLEALLPEYVQIDSHQIPDLLKFAADFASQINYYNSSNEIEGNWDDLFYSSPHLLTLLISKFNAYKEISDFNELVNMLKQSTITDQRVKALQKLFQYVSRFCLNFMQIHEQFIALNEIEQVEEMLVNIHPATEELDSLRLYYQAAAAVYGNNFEHKTHLFDKTNRIDISSSEQSIFTGDSNTEKILNSLPVLIEIFNSLNAKHHRLTEAAKLYISQNELFSQKLSPQVGLFIAFLDVFQHLQAKINKFNSRHLDFYYKELLGINPNEGQADKVHLIIDPNKGELKIELSSNCLFNVPLPDQEEIIQYKLESNVVVTSAQIAEIKTLFKSRFTQILAQDPHLDDIIESQIYQASHPVFDPSVYSSNPLAYLPWAAMGEDQHELSGDIRTMEDSTMGIVVGSPLFYLTEGERTINIKLIFKQNSIKYLSDYARNYSQNQNQSIEVTVHELFANAFDFTYTSGEAWHSIKNYTVVFDLEGKNDSALEIILRLNNDDPSFDIYQQSIHQLPFESDLPLLRINLNNYQENHPYSYFNSIQIERITINVDVKGFRSVMLQNNIGALSASNPFQAFGPQPTIGSFLDIKNSNVFNCFTKDFAIDIEWLNLPRDNGGLATYYKGYGAPFANDSFIVNLSAMNKGKFTPESNLRQTKRLFAMHKEDNQYLDSFARIENINFNKIDFVNLPSLRDEANSDTNFRDGVLRLEISSPTEAFGHHLFQQIFPEAVMRNAKRFSKKVPLPNQPLIPIIKSIIVDYCLEYSENFSESRNEDSSSIELFQMYPFGYDKIFPGNKKKNIYFIPPFPDDCNLLLGLKDVVPNTNLNLMFQFEEKCYNHTIYEQEIIKWSYLDNNRWQPFKKVDIVSDSTSNFIDSGIVTIQLPKELTTGNTVLNPDLFWIQASLSKSDGINPYIKSICTNGATARRISGPKPIKEADLHLPPGSIKDFVNPPKGIQKVWQLFTSFNGKMPETPEMFYTRVSERLRHKQRPVQYRDIIQVILDKFPQILIVKCFNPNTENYTIVPGVNLQLVLIPRDIEKTGVAREQPMVNLSTLHKVKDYLSSIISPLVNIEVGNPIYEKVKVICTIMLSAKASIDSGFYLRKLTQDINEFIAPWLFGKQDDVKIGSRIYKSELLLFIRTRPYIDYVTGFSIVHFFNSKDVLMNDMDAHANDSARDNVDYIASSSPASVFIPSAHHIINLIDKPEFELSRVSGIERFIIGEELFVENSNISTTSTGQDKTYDDEDNERFSVIITHNI